MSITGDGEGIRSSGGFRTGLEVEPFPKKQAAAWDSRKVEIFASNLDSTTEKVMELTTSQSAFLEQEQHVEKLLGELSSLVHELDSYSGSKSPDSLIALRKKVGSCMSAIRSQLESKVNLPENQTVQFARKTISTLEMENRLGLERMERPAMTSAASFQALSAIATNKGISDSLSQIEVLNQYADSTSSGFENCGYHALKNALIMLVPGKEPAELERLFKDKSLFLTFYNTYCLPLLTDAGRGKGKLDASVPLLRDILTNFSKDKSPPKELIPLQTALRTALKEESLAVFQMSTTTGDERGQPLFGFFDDKGSFEGKKLAELAKNPGPKTLSCVFGNEALGHWYTLTIHKTVDGQYQFLGTDSMDNNHDTLGIFSPLGKMRSLVLSKIAESDQFLKEAFQPIYDFLSPRANWFEPDGSLPEGYAASLMNNDPVPALASDDAPTGSVMERNIAQCFKAFDFIKDAGWTSSPDYWIQKQIGHLEKLVNFYAEILPLEAPEKGKMLSIAAYLQANKKQNIVEETIAHALGELEKRRDLVSSYKYTQTETAFTMMRTLYKERKSLAEVTDETQRNNRMNTLGDVKGVESGFTSGKKSSDVEKSLIEKLDLLLMTYQEAVRRGKFERMIEVIGTGDGCLTARMGRVTEFYSELQGLGTFEDTVSAEKIQEAPVTALSEALSSMAGEFIDQRADDAISQLDKSPEAAIESLRDYATGELGRPFRKFLADEKIIPSLEEGALPEADAIDWNAALPKALEKKNEVIKFIRGNKDQRFKIEAKGFILKLKPAQLLAGENFDIAIEQFGMYTKGPASKPFREFLVGRHVVPSEESIDWESALPKMSKLNEFNVWLNNAKQEALKYI